MIQKSLILSLILLLTTTAMGQNLKGLRLTAQAGYAVPFGDYAKAAAEGDYLNHDADRGFDFNLSGEIFITERLGFIIRLGYALHEVDEDQVKSFIQNPVATNTDLSSSPFQHLYASGGFGLKLIKISDKVDLQPYAMVGLNIMRTATKDYTYFDDAGSPLKRFRSEASVAPGLLIIPGLNLNMRITNFLEFRLYAEVFGSDHQAESELNYYDGTLTVPTNQEDIEVEYQVRTLNAGAALSFRF